MKSFIKIALLVFYVFFNAGLSYSMHFCDGGFERINLYAESKTCCESEEPMSGCCDDVSNLELPNTDQQVSDVLNFQPQTFELLNAEVRFELPINFIVFEEKTAFADSSPPIFQDTPIYIFCQVFLI
ncbi:hypothetical protein ADIS_4745 [Lunatimonas lonarensis]|uniref:Uncharacterized protein n=1 Tax=Lunatimonas lonarensis TaxID=1232681 RepID=R7ZL65_9BACT|nr:hypothetical protein [Lunatimonas lonarensis]EON74774.1 hypothetical protein ADIS_4745 [Lunatimonas lonarensis]